jgi:formylglycine-generating enzyme
VAMDSCCAGAPSNLELSRPGARISPLAKGGNGAGAKVEFMRVSAGSFAMGSADFDANPIDNEGPIREVWLESFEISTTPITNSQFAEFAAATGYVTEAEQIGWSFVFHLLVSASAEVIGRSEGAQWWHGVEGANWRCPTGGDSSHLEIADHPAVHISYRDAQAYCDWAGLSLPTEAQWEKAARGGLVSNRFPWGNDLLIDGNWQCNIFQGSFPERNSVEDGHLGTSPVKSFAPNGFGGYDFAGNVWEWTATRFESGVTNLLQDPSEIYMVTRGGSYLCHDSYCNRYRVGARNKTIASSVAGNIGFRVVGSSR